MALKDDFKMILHIKLFYKAKMVPMPYLRTIGILDEETSFMIQLRKGMKHGNEMHLVAIRKVQDDTPGIVSEVIVPVLEDFTK